MKKPVTKIICATLASVVALGVGAASGCSPFIRGNKLDGNVSGVVTSNGGFAVEKGEYVYFINGVAANTDENTFGTPVKGAVQRISLTDLNAHNYKSVQTVVPQIAYSANYETGIFIYGDRLYYSTPSTARNSDGEILNSRLEMKSTSLDGYETTRDAYVTFPSNSYDFRYVQVEDVVYLMYVATSETLYGESTGVTNLHSVNTSTGVDTLLAYNISSYLFDAEDKSNPRVFYTMSVLSKATGEAEKYNQVYSVTADATTPNEYDLESIADWWDDETNRYVNCGTLVFDGVGGRTTEKTPFNYKPDDAASINDLSYTYTLESYLHNTLFYTRTTTTNSSGYLFSVKDSFGENWNPISSNPAQDSGDQLLNDGTNADSYRYVFNSDGSLKLVIYADSAGGVTVNHVKDGKLSAEKDNKNYYSIVKEGTATILGIDGDYLYYSLTGGNGYTFYRIDYTGSWNDYEGMFPTDEVSEYTSVKILDLDTASDWYKPEFLAGHILFASETDNMTTYNYIMAFDLTQNGVPMSNNSLDSLNKKYEGINGDEGIIEGYADTDKYDAEIYANLSGSARYLFYTADMDYVNELAKALNGGLKENDTPRYSETTLKKLNEFLAPDATNDWADYTDKRTVNGKEVYANRRDYYYSVLGTMLDSDVKSYQESFKTDYLESWPAAEETTWWDGLNTVSRVFFIIGMCVLGLLVIGGIVLTVVLIVRKKRSTEQPVYSKRRIKVDTTDDKSVNVYDDEAAESADSSEKTE